MTVESPGTQAGRPVQRSRPSFRVSGVVLVVLGTVDVALVVASAGSTSSGTGPGDGALSLETDGGLVEYVGYLHQLVLVGLLLTVWRLRGPGVWFAWATVFALALADDSARLHETLGDRFAAGLGLPDEVAGLRADDLGELVVWGLLAVAPLVAIVWLYRTSDRATRAASRGLAVLVAAYAFFGVVVDQLHAAARDSSWGPALGTVEDGGELLVLSVAVAHVVTLVGAARRHAHPAARTRQPEDRASAAASSPPA